MTSHSQSNEQITLETLLAELPDQPTQRFLDCGAFHPTVFSNTRFLVEQGWGGVYVEPAPSNFLAFLNEYRANPKIELINAALGLSSSMTRFYDSNGDAVSTTMDENVRRWEAAGVKFRSFWLKLITWDDLLGIVGDTVSVLSLDAEGQSADLFMAMPLERLPSLRLAVVEHDCKVEQITAYAAQFKFQVRMVNGENVVLAR